MWLRNHIDAMQLRWGGVLLNLNVMWHKKYWWHHSALSTRPHSSTSLVTSVKVSKTSTYSFNQGFDPKLPKWVLNIIPDFDQLIAPLIKLDQLLLMIYIVTNFYGNNEKMITYMCGLNSAITKGVNQDKFIGHYKDW